MYAEKRAYDERSERHVIAVDVQVGLDSTMYERRKGIPVMQYQAEFKPQAIKDGKKIPTPQLQRIFDKIEVLQDNLTGDVKRLTNFTPEYR